MNGEKIFYHHWLYLVYLRLLEVYFLIGCYVLDQSRSCFLQQFHSLFLLLYFHIYLYCFMVSYPIALTWKTNLGYLVFMAPISSFKILGSKLLSTLITGVLLLAVICGLAYLDFHIANDVFGLDMYILAWGFSFCLYMAPQYRLLLSISVFLSYLPAGILYDYYRRLSGSILKLYSSAEQKVQGICKPVTLYRNHCCRIYHCLSPANDKSLRQFLWQRVFTFFTTIYIACSRNGMQLHWKQSAAWKENQLINKNDIKNATVLSVAFLMHYFSSSTLPIIHS